MMKTNYEKHRDSFLQHFIQIENNGKEKSTFWILKSDVFKE